MKRLLLALLLLSPIPLVTAKELACQSAVMPVNGFYLGVPESGALHFYAVIDGHWQRYPARLSFPIPADAKGMLFNERMIGVRRSTVVEFFEGPDYEGEVWESRGSIPQPQLAAGEVYVNGLFSTEKELLAIGPQRMVSFQADGEHELVRYDAVLPAKIDCAFDMLYFKTAVIAGGKVQFYQVTPGDAGHKATLKPLPEMTLSLPEDTDEVTMLQIKYLGIRKQDNIHFLQYDAKKKAWLPAAEIPDFDLRSRASLPEAKED